MEHERQAETAAAATAATTTTNSETGRDEGQSAGGETAAGAVTFAKRRGDLRFSALRNAIYHSARRGFYERAHQTCTAIALIGGSGAVAAIGQSMPVLATLSALLTTVASAVSLVFGFSVRAGEHAALMRRYYGLMAQIICVDNEPAARDIERQMVELYGEERPTMWGVDAVAFNSASGSLYGPKGVRVRITPWQSAMRHLLPFNGVQFPDVEAGPANPA